MPRHKPSEAMTNVCIRVPISIVEQLRGNGINLSENVLEHWRTITTASPTDPTKAKVETLIRELIVSTPTIVSTYKWDETKGESLVFSYLKRYGLTATKTEISEIISPIIWEEGEA